MGCGNGYRCGKCGYELTLHTGFGMMYAMVYRETAEQARSGKLGEKLRQFYEQNPDGALDCSTGIYFCSKCKDAVCEPKLDMYLPKEDADGSKSEDGGAVWPMTLKERYRLYARGPHRCEKCGGTMRPNSPETLDRKVKDGRMPCPRCGGRFEADLIEYCHWD